jgi:endonuclease/exonuclease/phosphatase family metal-dependent hydrolase
MATKLRRFTKRVLLISNSLVVFFFLLACLAPYLHPYSWWFISFLGLAFPFLFLAVLAFLITWLVIKKKFAWISGIALLLGIKSVTLFFSFHLPHAFNYKKEPGTLRVATWNVARFLEMKRNNNKGSQTRQKMLELIRQQDADIICMQEFFHSEDPAWYANIDYFRDKLHYPYHYFSQDNDGYQHYTGSIIFSRFPIIDSGIIRYPRPTLPDALIHADINVNGRIIRVYTTHLQSLQFRPDDYNKINEIKDADDSLLYNSRTIFSKLKRGVVHRSLQVDIIGEVLEDSPYPLLFCADLNDIPNSYTYSTVRGNMQDAFLKKGFGIGRTFSALSPTLRIDYIFADDHFKIRQFKRIIKNYSDHYMLLSDVELRRSKL